MGPNQQITERKNRYTKYRIRKYNGPRLDRQCDCGEILYTILDYHFLFFPAIWFRVSGTPQYIIYSPEHGNRLFMVA